MNWLNRGIQEKILRVLSDNYPNCLKATKMYNSLFPSSSLPITSNIPVDKQGLGLALTLGCEIQSQHLATLQSDEFQYFLKNIYYLEESGLIEITSIDSLHKNFDCKINHKGIDFLTDDGGLSAILGVVTVKLHSDTIQALIAAKIDQAEISDSEKSWLKKELGKIKDTALSTLTENAINAIPAATLITLLKKFVGL
ncbi:TPA: hypothetical protein WH380_002008 [Neisseria meningitidis]|uniref:hypothetical protein n=1 Tax=Neisseria meningitidis TaxID=487 RepID=UPI000E587629|nr:hypothetical protein [Neisseria meningitidis]